MKISKHKLKNSSDATEDKVSIKVFKHGQVTFVPHYFMKNHYVGPGYHQLYNRVTYTEDQLKRGGASESIMNLWQRNY